MFQLLNYCINIKVSAHAIEGAKLAQFAIKTTNYANL